jgi:hypothetical protein
VPEREGDQRERRERHQHGEHPPPAVAVGERAEWDPHQRAEQDGDRDHRRRLKIRQVERVLEVGAERPEQAPRVEADREGERGERERGSRSGLVVVAHRERSEVVA